MAESEHISLRQRAFALRSKRQRARLGAIVLLGGWCVCAASQSDAPPKPQADAASAEEISTLISTLGDPSYAKRNEAMRRLLAIGPAAADALRTASKQESYEIAARAGRVLAIVEQLLFTGVEVELEFSREAVSWDDPVDLMIKMTNSSDYEARVPFELSAPPDRTPGDDDLHQLGLMLDAAEHLTVIGPHDRPIDLRVDDITSEAAARTVVDARLDRGPVSVLKPGQTATLVLRGFNQGWARYPLLDAGATTVQFTYEPVWPDDELYDPLRQKGTWEVTSERAKVSVTRAAPSDVSRLGRQARLEVLRDGDRWSCRLICTYDLPIWVNTNLGKGLPFAKCRWVGTFGQATLSVPAGPARAMTLRDFTGERVVRVQPGAAIEIARIEDADLRRAFVDQGADFASEWTLHADYLNLCDRSWQRREEPLLKKYAHLPEILRKPLHRRMLVLHLTSPTIRMNSE